MTIADHIELGLGLGLGLVTALGGPDLRNGGPSEWRTQITESSVLHPVFVICQICHYVTVDSVCQSITIIFRSQHIVLQYSITIGSYVMATVDTIIDKVKFSNVTAPYVLKYGLRYVIYQFDV